MVRSRILAQTAGLLLAKLKSSEEQDQGQELAKELLAMVPTQCNNKTSSRSRGTRPRLRSLAFRKEARAKMMVKILKDAQV